MVDAVTNNYSLTTPLIGGDVGTWGTPLNGDLTALDAILGQNFSTTITNADVTLTTTQFQNGIFVVSGTLTGNRNLIVPISTNSATAACGGKFVVVNNGAGAFNLTVKTAAAGSVGPVVPQGFVASLYSDTVNVGYTISGAPGYARASNGNPNGALTGTAGSVNTNASLAWDYTNKVLYASLGGTSWTTVLQIPAAVVFYVPDIQVFTSGSSATYTTPTNGGNLPLYLRVRMVGGGGGGGASQTNTGQTGNTTTFDSWTAIGGGAGGSNPTSAGNPGRGGSGGASGTGTLITRVAGGGGMGGVSNQTSGTYASGAGGNSFFGGGAASVYNTANGLAGATNSGGGGSGGADGNNHYGAGGGAGEFVEFVITSPAASYTYTVGTGGAGGTAGTQAGGAGAAGRIEVIGYWQ